MRDCIAIDRDFAVCDCSALASLHHKECEVQRLEAYKLREHCKRPFREGWRCARCGVRWLVWRTESPTTFWPTSQNQRHIEGFPDGAIEVAPLYTKLGLFVARRAVLVEP